MFEHGEWDRVIQEFLSAEDDLLAHWPPVAYALRSGTSLKLESKHVSGTNDRSWS